MTSVYRVTGYYAGDDPSCAWTEYYQAEDALELRARLARFVGLTILEIVEV